MQERHQNREKYFNEQIQTTARFVIPYIEKLKTIFPKTRVLEIGCGEGGNLIPFLEKDCNCVGIDLNKRKIELGKDYFSTHDKKQNIKLILDDIYNCTADVLGQFDIIIMRDVIEHIHNQEKFMAFAKRFLKDDGVFFLGFPPWQNPFGGHQQVCKNKLASLLPYYHLLPKSLYRFFLKLFGENDRTIEALLDIKETGISIDRFKRILKKENYTVLDETIFFINPNYQIKFGLKPRKQLKVFAKIPYFRNFISTAAYYLIRK